MSAHGAQGSDVPWSGNVVDRTCGRYRPVMRDGQPEDMAIIIVLIVLALIFGIGSVLEGLAWGFLIVVGLIVGAAFLGYRKLSSSR